MSAQLIILLLTTFGQPAIQLIDSLIEKYKTNGVVTTDEWAALSASLKTTAQDHMKAQLTAAGIDLNSPQAQALLALSK
jgi:hypothetical protein